MLTLLFTARFHLFMPRVFLSPRFYLQSLHIRDLVVEAKTPFIKDQTANSFASEQSLPAFQEDDEEVHQVIVDTWLGRVESCR